MSPEQSPPEQESTSEQERTPELESYSTWSKLIGLLFYVAIGLYYAWNYTSSGQEFLKKWWWAVVLAIAIISVLAQHETVKIRLKGLERITPKGRIALIIFLVIPLMLVLVGAVVILPEKYQVFVIRSIFFLSVCLFPATMYYLFISSRKYSLFDEFISNLQRLGLCTRMRLETEEAYKRRKSLYRSKFQGAYGSLPSDDLFTSEIFISETTFPVIFATVLISLGWLTILPPWQDTGRPMLETFTPEKTPVNFAFLGAYFFSVQMLFRRYARLDMRTGAYVAVSLRIILAVIGIWAVEALMSGKFNNTQLTVVGFVIGVFPQTAWQFVQAFTKKIGGFFIPSLKTPLPLSELDGLTVWNEARLEEEDIENIPNMATADIAELMLTTRISPDRIIDWVDQAILYTHLGHEEENKSNEEQSKKLHEQRWKLRSYGIRTATSLIEVCGKEKECNIQGDQETLEMIHSLEKAIKTNPNLEMIQTWKIYNSKSNS